MVSRFRLRNTMCSCGLAAFICWQILFIVEPSVGVCVCVCVCVREAMCLRAFHLCVLLTTGFPQNCLCGETNGCFCSIPSFHLSQESHKGRFSPTGVDIHRNYRFCHVVLAFLRVCHDVFFILTSELKVWFSSVWPWTFTRKFRSGFGAKEPNLCVGLNVKNCSTRASSACLGLKYRHESFYRL